MRELPPMSSLALILALGAMASAGPVGPDARLELVKPDVAVTRVANCGFKSVRSRFDDTLQEDVIEVSDVSSASTEQLQCVALASLDSHYYVTFPEPMYQAYAALYWRMSEERGKADAKAWLEKRGLLSRLPTFDPKRSDEATFARSLEKLCGPKAAGTLKAMGGGATFTDGALGTFEKGGYIKGRLDEDAMWCLINAATASGYRLGFIGNEAYREQR